MNFPTASCSARSRAVSIVSGSSTTNTPSLHLPLNFPLAGFQNREFRVGYDLTTDVQKHTARNVVCGAIRLAFHPAGFGGLRP